MEGFENILGIDPGTKNVGFSLLQESGWKLWTKKYDGIHTGIKVCYFLARAIKQLDVKIVAVEALPTLAHPMLMMKLSEVVAGVSIAAFQAKIKFAIVHPSSWKKAVGGFKKGMSNERLIGDRYHFNFFYDEHAAAATGVATALLEEGQRIPYGKIKWTDFSKPL